MTDNKHIIDWHDRARVAAAEDYEVSAFARRHGMSPEEVRDLIARIGNDRDALEREAAKLRRH